MFGTVIVLQLTATKWRVNRTDSTTPMILTAHNKLRHLKLGSEGSLPNSHEGVSEVRGHHITRSAFNALGIFQKWVLSLLFRDATNA